jgi:hypothetical protein
MAWLMGLLLLLSRDRNDNGNYYLTAKAPLGGFGGKKIDPEI